MASEQPLNLSELQFPQLQFCRKKKKEEKDKEKGEEEDCSAILGKSPPLSKPPCRQGIFAKQPAFLHLLEILIWIFRLPNL